MTHICVSKLTIIGSDNGLSPGRRQAIIWTNAGILLIWPLGTNFSEISIEILGLNALIHDEVISWGCFLYYWPFVRVDPMATGQTIEEIVELPMIWDATTLIWCHCHMAFGHDIGSLFTKRTGVLPQERSREVSKPWDLCLDVFGRSGICQAPR